MHRTQLIEIVLPVDIDKRRCSPTKLDWVPVSLDSYWPLLFAQAQDRTVRYLLFGNEFIGKERLDVLLRQKLEHWMTRRDPLWRRTAAQLAYDQWLRARNKREVKPLPDADDLLAPDALPTAFDGPKLYRIESGRVLAGYRLEVRFRNGETRITDVQRMRAHAPLSTSIVPRSLPFI